MILSAIQFARNVVRRLIHAPGRLWGTTSLGQRERARREAVQRLIDQSAVMAARLQSLEQQTAARLQAFEQQTVAGLQALEQNQARTTIAEINRLDGYLVYHAGTLSRQIDELAAGLASRFDALSREVRGASKWSYVQPDLDALLVSGEFDLLVPTVETGLLSYFLRHGLEGIEPGVRAVLKKRLRAGATVVDVGASLGVHALTMAHAVGPGGRVVCIEPMPHIASALKRTLRLNGFSERSEVICAAATDSAGEATFHCSPHSPMSSLFPISEESANIKVPTLALNDRFAEGQRVDLVKIDVEGAEPLVYRGMSRILRENPEIVLILEWSASHFTRSGQSPEAFWDLIQDDNFQPFLIEDKTPGDLAAIEAASAIPDSANILLTRQAGRGPSNGRR
jgi:FkbM family methyltransferase